MALAVPSPSNFALGGLLASRSPRERVLLLVVALMGLGAVLFFAFSGAQTARAANIDAQAQLEAAQTAAGRAAPGGLAGRLAEARSEVTAWSWSASSPETGQVMVQSSLRRAAESAGLADVKVEGGRRFEAAGEVVLAPVAMTSDFSWLGLSSLIAALDASGKGFLVDSVEMTDEGELRLSLWAPIAVAGGSGA